jgi:hypothetical protein
VLTTKIILGVISDDHIKNNFDEIGTFDSCVGDLFFYNELMIIPTCNIQLGMTHPLNGNNSIMHIDYSYLTFKKVYKSIRDTCFNRDTNNKIVQLHYLNDNNNKISLNHFLLEVREFDRDIVYWNWNIFAESFFLVVPDFYKIESIPFQKKDMCTDMMLDCAIEKIYKSIKQI